MSSSRQLICFQNLKSKELTNARHLKCRLQLLSKVKLTNSNQLFSLSRELTNSNRLFSLPCELSNSNKLFSLSCELSNSNQLFSLSCELTNSNQLFSLSCARYLHMWQTCYHGNIKSLKLGKKINNVVMSCIINCKFCFNQA